MATIMTKRGNLDNVVTFENICDTTSDLQNIKYENSTLGSVAIVLDDNGALGVYMANSNHEWLPLLANSSGGDSSGGMSIHICSQDEYNSETGIPTISNPDATTLYLVPNGGEDSNNMVDEWIYVNEHWEKFGSSGGGTISGSDWLAASGAAGYISNKPTMFAAAGEGSVIFNHQYANTAAGNYSLSGGQGCNAVGAQSFAFGGGSRAEGTYSVAFGGGSNAIGMSAFAEGAGGNAKGTGSHVEGGGCTTGANAAYAHAEGENNTVSGESAHVEGKNNTASGFCSHAEGGVLSTDANTETGCTASGECSHAEGYKSRATGDGSHAEGRSIASGIAAHSEGAGSAHGFASHGEGSSSATGMNAHAEGSSTTASGEGSHAEGSANQAEGLFSHVEGVGNKATFAMQHVFGQFCAPEVLGDKTNSDQGTYVEIVGGGSQRVKNNIRTLDWSGNEYLQGQLTAKSLQINTYQNQVGLTIGTTTLTENQLIALLALLNN